MNQNDALTLDPPGTIAVVGAGPIGLEAALYGRYLGYNVRLIEKERVAASWQDDRDETLSINPSDCLSNLAKDAVIAQRGLTDPMVMPMTVGNWIDDFLIPLSRSDLLIDRIIEGEITHVDAVDVEPSEEEDDPADDVPPDFRLTIEGPEESTLLVEAMILTPADVSRIQMGVPEDASYLFRVVADAELVGARRQIVDLFAGLGGRPGLDLYRPRRGS